MDQKRSAFDCLMASSKKKKRKRFVTCPNCGSSILEDLIHPHLDDCCSSSTIEKQQNTELPQESVYHTNRDAQPTVRNESSPKPSGKEEGKNAFAHMMQQSKKLQQAAQQRFHLHADYSLTWSDGSSDESIESTQWSSTIQLRQPDNPSKIQLILSTSIVPSDNNNDDIRLVKRHSRLSVPVLKSILQKSIRRRRPLPATRVAMELMDKALGELLRRLPVIILEDSTLHPGFGLVCWLMAAESKNYKIPLELITRVLQIVYEVASCPWKDNATTIVEPPDGDTTTASTCSTEPHHAVLLKAMDLRMRYGGMKCDVTMLRLYHAEWERRWKSATMIPANSRLGADATWSNIPDLIHGNKGMQHAIALTKDGLDRLQFKDICLEGVDFHCSNVLENLMNDDDDCARIDQIMGNKQTKDQRLRILQKCMWRYSSGVNYRQPLLMEKESKLEDDSELKRVWDTAMAKRAKEFMTQYVQSRLVAT